MEPHSLDMSLYKDALVVLGAAGVVIPLFHRLRISSVVGFMLVGVVVGPFGIASLAPHLHILSAITISEPDLIAPIADLGVALLLFMIGLELSFERLWTMRRLVFGLGSLQVVGCAAVLVAAAVAIGQDWHTAVVIGLALAMSSTAVVIQVLSEEKRLNTATGRPAFAVLLFQDLAVVPILFAVGALSSAGRAVTAAEVGIAVGQAVLAVAAIVALGRLVLRPLFRSVAHTRSAELFVAACLLVVIATGLATAEAGLSNTLLQHRGRLDGRRGRSGRGRRLAAGARLGAQALLVLDDAHLARRGPAHLDRRLVDAGGDDRDAHDAVEALVERRAEDDVGFLDPPPAECGSPPRRLRRG